MSHKCFDRQIMTVQRIDQSPMNPKRWCLTLSCGHEVWVTSGKKPTRLKEKCERCHKLQRLLNKLFDTAFKRVQEEQSK